MNLNRLLLGASGIALLCGIHAAAAQTAATPAAAAPADAAAVSEVVVTGSLLRSGFATATPVTVESTEQLKLLSPNNVGEALAMLPAFVGSQVTSSGGASSPILANSQALVDLRALGANRTLVLLDGQRLPASNINGSVDTNVIPQSLLSRVDVVTGGASSTYGSDAVAGVVNFVLNTKFTGLEISVNGGETTYGDAANGHVTVTGGKAFADGRLRVEGSVDYFHQDGIQLGHNGRDWYDHPAGLIAMPVGSATQMGIVPNVAFSTMTLGGLITKLNATAGHTVSAAGTAALLNTQFGAGGAILPFNPGTIHGAAFQSGGDGASPINELSPEQDRWGVFLHGEYDLSDKLTVFGDFLYSESRTDSIGTYAFEQTTRAFTIYNDNAFLTPALSSLMAANNIASFTVGRLSPEMPVENRDVTSLTRFHVGLRGQINDRWSYDGDLAYNQSVQDFAEYNTINRALYAAADAVRDPSGNIVCRSTLAGLDPGCVPINIMGPNTISKAGVAYVSQWDDGKTTDDQTTINANLRGDLGDSFTLGAGPISVAAGAAWRRDKIDRVVSPLAPIFTSCAGLRPTGCSAYDNVYGGYQTYNPGPLHGSIDVSEAYGELGIPLLKDLPFVKNLNLDLAGRATHYSTSGTVYTWKIGPNWQLTDEFRIRSTRSQDIRAPSANDLFSSVSSSTSTTSNLYPNSKTGANVTTNQLTVGNPNLQPEVAQTFTLGGVYQPAWLPGLQGSVDYYNIKISNAIGGVPAQTIIDGCSAGIQSDCALITVGGAPVTTTAGINASTAGVVIQLEPANIASIRTSGLDGEVSYRTDVYGGRLTLRALGNYTSTYFNSSLTAPTGPSLIGALGINGLAASTGGGLPRWTANFTEIYDYPLSGDRSVVAALTERVISSGEKNPNLTALQLPFSQNRVPTIAYTDLTATYRFSMRGSKAELFLSVQNLFDQSPPVDPSQTSFQQPTNYQIYDVLGRRFTLGIKAKW